MKGFRLIAAFAALMTCVPHYAAARDIIDEQNFDIVVSGSVREVCALGSVSDMDFGNLERRGLGAETRVRFYCNLPFTMTVKGDKGALTHTSMPNGQGPYAGKVPYSIGIDLPLRYPQRRTVTKTFNSRQVLGGAVIPSNGGIATDDMILNVKLGEPSRPAGLLAGEYSEQITITVSPL